MNISYLQGKVKANYNPGVLLFASVFLLLPLKIEWGFYAHREINYYAAFTIPPPLNQFFKEHIHYLSEHAIDPDRRRYANPNEGWRHYIDLDIWMDGDSCTLSQNYFHDRVGTGMWSVNYPDRSKEAKFTGFCNGKLFLECDSMTFEMDSVGVSLDFGRHDYDTEFSISEFLYSINDSAQLVFEDRLIENGVLPYDFTKRYRYLVRSMEEKDVARSLQLCAELGHYISDAHVPLHTTSNYDGQKTGQDGIHAFWETRIPELFAERDFSHWVGKSDYIEDKNDFIWNIVMKSHQLVDVVLKAEKIARSKVREQDHFCFEDRSSQFVRTQCPEFAEAYQTEMDGMVEERWKASIKAVGSIWLSAWMDAGEPKLWVEKMELDTAKAESLFNRLERAFSRGRIMGRDH